MTKPWLEELSCATHCSRCQRRLQSADLRILSVYDHHAICMQCKNDEESRDDYQETSKSIAEQCLINSESGIGDPRGYCYHHFYPYQCSTPR